MVCGKCVVFADNSVIVGNIVKMSTSQKILKSKSVFENSLLRLKIDSLEVSPGNRLNYVYIVRKQAGVSVVPYFSKSDSLIMVSQYRHPIRKTIWQFPGGGRAKGRTFAQTAREELEEETGYLADKLVDLGRCYPDVGVVGNVGRVFLAVDPKESNRRVKSDPREVVTSKIFPFNRVKSLIQRGEIRDGWTLSSFLLFTLWKRGQ